MTATARPASTLGPDSLAYFERTLRAMLDDRIEPICSDEGTLARHHAQTRALEDALERVVLGTYGRCATCAGPVTTSRLEVVPTARTCRACAAGAIARCTSRIGTSDTGLR